MPLLVQMGAWSRRFTETSKEPAIRAQLLVEGGPPLWDAFVAELRAHHLGGPPAASLVLAELQAAYEQVVARKIGAAGTGRRPRKGP